MANWARRKQVAGLALALAAAIWQGHRSAAAIALASGLIGIAVSLATNISLSMLSLSQQFASATSLVQKADLLAVGQALLAPYMTYLFGQAYAESRASQIANAICSKAVWWRPLPGTGLRTRYASAPGS